MLKLSLLITVLVTSITFQDCGSQPQTLLANANSAVNSSLSKDLKPTLFVDINYSGGNSDGSAEKPFTKIKDALESAGPGAVIEVAQGKYEETLSISRNVSVIGKVTRNEKNEIIKRPVITSPDGTIVSITGKHLTFDGFEIVGSTNFDKYDGSGNLVSLGGYSRNCESEPTGIFIGEDAGDITISHNYIHQIGHDYIFCIEKKYDCDDKHPCINSHGINAYNYTSKNIQSVKILDNIVSNLHLGQSEAVTLNGNVTDFEIENNIIHNVDNIAIDIGGFQSACATQNTDECRARNGSISNNAISKLVGTKDPTNKLSFNPGQRKAFPFIGGIYIDGGKSVTIERNIVSEFGVGIEIGSEWYKRDVENVDVINNILYDNKISEISVGKFEEVGDEKKVQRSFVRNCRIINNTIRGRNDNVEELYAMLEFKSGKICSLAGSEKCKTPGQLVPNIEGVIVANNLIFIADSKKIAVRVTGDGKNFQSKVPVRFRDPDVKFFNNQFPLNNVTWEWYEDGEYSTVENFQQALKTKASGNFKADPAFENSNDPNKCVILKNAPGNVPLFMLASGSASIDKGKSYDIFTTLVDICGNPRVADGKIDIGAFEYKK